MQTARRIFGILLLSALVAAATVLVITAGPGSLAERVQRVVYHGRPAVTVRVPVADQQVPVGSVEVLVSFARGRRLAVGSFRCLLNGRDVTDRLTVGENGAIGSVAGLTEGPNALSFEIFAQSWWGGAYFEDRQTVHFRVRPMPQLDRA